jgi:homoserine kinase
MSIRAVKAYAPASISNIGPGFDVLGLAIDKPGDVAVAQRDRQPGLSFVLRGKTDGIPSDARTNVAAFVAALLLGELKPSFGVKLTLDKKMPISSGLGSSAASGVAALMAVNALLGSPLTKSELIPFALEGERIIAGSAHADNIAPSLLGGAVIVRSYDPLDVIKLRIRNSIFWVVAHPHCVVSTAYARKILPEMIPLKSAVRQWGNVGGIVAGLIKGDAKRVGTCVEDVIVEPLRAGLIPGFHDVKHAALEAGATGCSISGSGPSIFAVAISLESAKKIAGAMKRAFGKSANMQSDLFISRANLRGAMVV